MRHQTTKAHRWGPLLALALALTSLGAHAADPGPLPPPVGPVGPRVEPIKEEDGLYHQSWFQLSFFNLKDDFAEAKAAGKRSAVIFEQRGCPYCAKLHTEVLAQRYINDYLRENFTILQLDLWGAREVTDFDGTVLPERALAERWGVIHAHRRVLQGRPYGLEASGARARSDRALPLSYAATPHDLFVGAHKLYERDRNPALHISRIAER
jgi:thioredoxin-related protein